MAARRQRRDDSITATRGDEEAPDPTEAADTDDGDELDEAGLAELEVDEDDFDDDEDEDDDSVVDEDEPVEVPLEEGEEPDEDEAPVVAAVPADAAFDDEDEARVVAAVAADEDEDDDEIEGLRDGEFVCRSCYMAKRESQLADPDRMLCRDCA